RELAGSATAIGQVVLWPGRHQGSHALGRAVEVIRREHDRLLEVAGYRLFTLQAGSGARRHVAHHARGVEREGGRAQLDTIFDRPYQSVVGDHGRFSLRDRGAKIDADGIRSRLEPFDPVVDHAHLDRGLGDNSSSQSLLDHLVVGDRHILGPETWCMNDPDHRSIESVTSYRISVDDDGLGSISEVDDSVTCLHRCIECIACDDRVGAEVQVDTSTLEYVVRESHSVDRFAVSADGHGPVVLRQGHVVSEDITDDRQARIAPLRGRLAIDVLIAGLRELASHDDEVVNASLDRDPGACTGWERRTDHDHAPNLVGSLVSDQPQAVTLARWWEQLMVEDDPLHLDVLDRSDSDAGAYLDGMGLLRGVRHGRRIENEITQADVLCSGIDADDGDGGSALVPNNLQDRPRPITDQLDSRCMNGQGGKTIVRAGGSSGYPPVSTSETDPPSAARGSPVDGRLNRDPIV